MQTRIIATVFHVKYLKKKLKRSDQNTHVDIDDDQSSKAVGAVPIKSILAAQH